MAGIKESRSTVVGGALGPLTVADLNGVRKIIDRLLEEKAIKEESEAELIERLDTYLKSVIDEKTSVGKIF